MGELSSNEGLRKSDGEELAYMVVEDAADEILSLLGEVINVREEKYGNIRFYIGIIIVVFLMLWCVFKYGLFIFFAVLLSLIYGVFMYLDDRILDVVI